MGISTRYYTIFGVKLEWNDELCEECNEVYDEPDTPFVLMDSMSTRYIIPGVVLFDSGDLRWHQYKDTFKEIDPSQLNELESEYRKQFTAKFPKFSTLLDKPFKIMTLVDYS